MGKLISDKLNAETLEPVVLNPKTLNNYKENTALNNDELEEAQNIIFDNGIIEKMPGITRINPDWLTVPVTGLHRAYSRGTEKKLIRIANGIMKADPNLTNTVLSGLSNNPTSFVNVRGKAWGINQSDGIIRYDPQIAYSSGNTGGQLTNIISPYMRKKISFFESDETWVGGTASYGIYRPDEWSGSAICSRNLSAATSGTQVSYRYTMAVLDLSKFTNGKASTDEDLICFYAFHDSWNNINYLKLEFSSIDTLFTKRFETYVYQNKFAQGDFEWTLFEVKKGAFAPVGATPNWNDIKAIRITAAANANGPVNINMDFLHMKMARPKARALHKSLLARPKAQRPDLLEPPA